MKTLFTSPRLAAFRPSKWNEERKPLSQSSSFALRATEGTPSSSSPGLPVSPSPSLSSFNPALPEDGAVVMADVLRDQFNGLAGMIEAVPTISSAQVDGVSTLPPGDQATVSVQIVGDVLSLTFGIPQGYAGPQGPPFAQAIVDSVSTLAPGDPATVNVYFDGTYVHFSFGIPQGVAGGAGPQGEPGPPGEVTTAALNAGLAAVTDNSSANSNSVATLDTPFTDPDAEALRVAFNGLVTALRR